MSNRGAVLSGIGVGNAISQSEMLQAIALRQNKELQEKRFQEEKQNREQIRKSAASTYLSNVLDKKDFFSASPYDPIIVHGLDSAMQQGQALAAKGADTPTIMMAIAPTIGKLNDYQSKARQIGSNIKSSIEKLKQFPGYNPDALKDEAEKAAYYDSNGKLRDISEVDPNVDYVSTVLKNSPDKVTTSAGIDNFVNTTPLSEESKEVQTMYGGKKRNLKYDVKRNYWEGISEDANGNAITDHTGQPVGIDVKSHVLTGSDGKPLIDTETKQPFRVMDDNEFKGIMSRSPAIADHINGQVIKHFRDAGAQQPPSVGSPEWEDMAKHILYQELKTRSRASFKQRDVETKTNPLTKIELGIPAFAPKKGGSGSDVEINDVYKEVKNLTDTKKEGMGAPLNELSSTAQTAILDMAKKMTGDNELSQADIYVQKDGNSVNIMSYPAGKVIAPLTARDINLKVNTTVKPKQKVLEETKEKTYNYKGKSMPESAVKKAADASGMSIEEYKKAVGIK